MSTLTRPDGTDPDGFAQHIAEIYRELIAGKCRKPGVRIAAMANVPVGTAQRWIMDARRRGHLEPAYETSVWKLVADELGVTPHDLRAAVAKHTSRGLQL